MNVGMIMCVGQRIASGVGSHLPPHSDRALVQCWVGLLACELPGIVRQSPPSWILAGGMTASGSSVDSEGQNSGIQACVASALPIEPCPYSPESLLRF